MPVACEPWPGKKKCESGNAFCWCHGWLRAEGYSADLFGGAAVIVGRLDLLFDHLIEAGAGKFGGHADRILDGECRWRSRG